ncbi:MAG: hypothetical protein IRZ21_05630 [Thermoleophilaceae bacterium]|nr:hypothetical protein [Thermoleophilaceae bacterium]
MTRWDWILWLHLLAMAFFVGGQLMLAAVVVPVARRSGDRDALRSVARRFGVGTLVAIAVLIATGSAMADHFQLWDDTKLQVKLTLVVVAGLLVGLHMRWPELHVIEGLVFLVSLAIVALGVSLP